MKVALIVAVAENGVIGRDRGLPWRLSTDLRRFKRLTMGHHLLMGRKTFESIGRALPGRTTVVISRGEPELPPGVVRAGSLEKAIALAAEAGDDEAFVAGGAEIFRLALPRADRIYLTRVRADIDGDVRLAELFAALAPADNEWRLLEQEEIPRGERDDHATTFEIWERSASTSREEAP